MRTYAIALCYVIVLRFLFVRTNTVSDEAIGGTGGVYRVDRRDLQYDSFANFYPSNGNSRRRNTGVDTYRVDRRDYGNDQPFSSDDYLQPGRYERAGGGGENDYVFVQRTSSERTRSLPRLFVPAGGETSQSPFDWRRNYNQIMPISAYLGGGHANGIGYESRTPRAVLAAPLVPRQTFDVAPTMTWRPIVYVDDNALPTTTVKDGAAVDDRLPVIDNDSSPLPAITNFGKSKINRRVKDEEDRPRWRSTVNELSESGEESDLVETFEPKLLGTGGAHGTDVGDDDGDMRRPIKRRRRLSGVRSANDYANLVDVRQFSHFVPVVYERTVVESVEMRRHETGFDWRPSNFDDDGSSSWWPSVVLQLQTPNESEVRIENRKGSFDDNRSSILPVTEKPVTYEPLTEEVTKLSNTTTLTTEKSSFLGLRL